MVHVGAAYDYHDRVDENAEPSWTNVIRDAVKDFVGAVAETSNQLAGAAEKFAADSMNSIDEAAARAERSASTSNDMAQVAQKAAEDARLAADSLQSAVAEASERIRGEASEGAAMQFTQVQEAGERLRTDLQSHVDEMISRMAQTAGTNQDAIAAAEAATVAAREAADRVQQSVSNVEAAVANAQRAADEARAAAERTETSAGSIGEAVTAAQEAAEASRASAEQASAQSSLLGGEANMLLERLETDYELLTRLVRDLHGRISTLSLPAVPGSVSSGQPVAFADAPAGEPAAPSDADPSYWPHFNDEVPDWKAPVAEATIEPEAVVETALEGEPESNTYAQNETAIDDTAVPEAVIEPEAVDADYSAAFSFESPAWVTPAPEAATEPEAGAEPAINAEVSYTPELSDENPIWEMAAPEATSEPEAVGEPAIEGEPSSWPEPADEDAAWDIADVEPEIIAESEADAPVAEEAPSYIWTPPAPGAEAPAPSYETPSFPSSSYEGPVAPDPETPSPSYETPSFETPAYESPSPAASYEAPAYETPSLDLPVMVSQQTSIEPVSEPESEVAPDEEPAPIEVSVSGRVQVRISPVPDFDRLLNLDGALSRVSGVDSVTLADYEQEEVTFRVEVLGEKDAGLFTREIAVSAGLDASLVDAVDNGLVIRIN